MKLGESLSLPCKTQGRPKTRIVWEKIDFDVVIPTESNENDSQEKFISKTKILSFRSKRDENKSKNITTIINVVNRTNFDNNSFKQTSKRIHRRSVNDNANDDSHNDDNDVEDDDDSDNSSSNDDVSNIDLLAATTPFVESQPKLKVNANGDLLIGTVTQKNEVGDLLIKTFLFFYRV